MNGKNNIIKYWSWKKKYRVVAENNTFRNKTAWSKFKLLNSWIRKLTLNDSCFENGNWICLTT